MRALLLFVLLALLMLSLAWASMKDGNPAQQSLPGYVLKVEVWRDSSQSTITTAWATDTLPDSLVLTVWRDSGDSLRTVYRPAPASKPAPRGE